MRRLAFVTPFSSVHRCFFVDVRFIEDSLPSCATRFKQFCWISGTKPGVENRLHADHEMAKLDKAETGWGSALFARYATFVPVAIPDYGGGGGRRRESGRPP